MARKPASAEIRPPTSTPRIPVTTSDYGSFAGISNSVHGREPSEPAPIGQF